MGVSVDVAISVGVGGNATVEVGCKAPLQSVLSATICLLSHDLSAWQQSVNVVCQLSCNTAAQLHPVSSDQTRQLSCNLSAELQPVSSDDTCHVSCNVLAEL